MYVFWDTSQRGRCFQNFRTQRPRNKKQLKFTTMSYLLKDTQNEGMYFKGAITVSGEANFLELLLTDNEDNAFDFEDEGQGALALSVLNADSA
ncbi:MAG: hypothetical protein ACRC2J_20870, partial [Microcoleaceae cyanobacterium]